MLEDIKKIKKHESISEVFRFCVKEVYHKLMNDHGEDGADPDLMYKIYKAQIYALYEIIKIHQGKKEDSNGAIEYFEELRAKIESK